MRYQKYKAKILEDPRSKKLSFKPDGRNHYVYRVSHIHIGIHYYGSKTENRLDSIGIKYFTSSSIKSFQKDFKENREDYKVKVIRYFDCPGDKILFESYIHYKLDVKARYNFINQVNQTPFGFDRTGISLTESHKNLISKKHLEISTDPIRSIKRSENIITAQQLIADDPIKALHRFEAHSKSAIEANAAIAADPKRSALRKKNQSRAAVKRNDSIKKDPIRYKKRSEKMSRSATEAQLKIALNPTKAAEKSRVGFESALKGHKEIAANPIRYAARSKAQREGQDGVKADPIKSAHKSKLVSMAASKPVEQYDLEDNFLKEFQNQIEASKCIGQKNSSGISQCINGRIKTCGGFKWKLKIKGEIDG